MKSLLTSGLSLSILLIAGLGFSLVSSLSELERQTEYANRYQQQLLKQTEQVTQQRLILERRIAELESALTARESEVSALSNSIDELQDRVNPDYGQMLVDAQQQVLRENQRRRGPDLGAVFSRPENAERLARMQVGSRFGDFVASLDGDEIRIQEVRDLLIQITSERGQLANKLRNGEISVQEATEMGTDEYLVEAMAAVLNEEEVAAFDEFQSSELKRSLRNAFDDQLETFAPSLDESSHALVLETLLNELAPTMDSVTYSMPDGPTMVERMDAQLEAYSRMRDLVSSELTDQQRAELDEFIEAKTVTLEITRDAYAEVNQ